METIKICMNYDRDDPNEVAARGRGTSNFMVPMMLEHAFERRDDVVCYRQDELLRGFSDEGEAISDVHLIINSMPMNQLQFIKNKNGLTAWWDLEECSDPKREFYEPSDIIFHPNYNPYRWKLYPYEKASYLPLANDFIESGYKYYPDEPLEYDVSFLGREELGIYTKRTRIINKLKDAGLSATRGQMMRGEPSARFISKGRLTIQISGWDNLEERFFQFGAIRPIMCDYLEEMDLVAERDKDYISFVTDEECVEKALYYTSHLSEAETIGNRLIEKLKKYHTYDARAEEVIRIIKGGKLNKQGQYLWDKAKANNLPTEYPGDN